MTWAELPFTLAHIGTCALPEIRGWAAHIAGYALPRYGAFHIGGKRKLESDHVYAMILATYVECR